MLFEVKEGIWFDNLSAAIHKGTPGAGRGLTAQDAAESPRREGWHPTLVYLSSGACPSGCLYCYAGCGSRGIQTAKSNFTFNDYTESYEHLRQALGGFDTVAFFGDPLSGFEDLRRFVEDLHKRLPLDELPDFAIHVDPAAVSPEQLDFLERYGFRIATGMSRSDQAGQEQDRALPDAADAADRRAYNRALRGIDRFTDRDIHVFAQYTFDRAQLDRYEPGLAAAWYSRLEQLQIDNYEVIPAGAATSRTSAAPDTKAQQEEARERYLAFCEESADYYLNKLLDDDIAKLPRMFVGLLLRVMTRTLHPDCSAGYSVSITPDRQVFPCHAFASDDRFAVSLDRIHGEDDLLNNVWFRSVREADRLDSAKCEKCIARRVCGMWCKAQALEEESRFDDSSEERCMLMNVYTRRIVQFLVEHYPEHREQIRAKLIRYDREQLQVKNAYEN